MAPAVGFPTPDTILITKTDFSIVLAHVNALNAWIRAASACLESQ